MKKPENFDKINNVNFTTSDGSTFSVEVSSGHSEGTVFVFYDDNDEREAINCILFDIEWGKNTFSIKRCHRGMGTNGDWILMQEPIHKSFVLTPKNFTEFLKSQTEKFIDNFFN